MLLEVAAVGHPPHENAGFVENPTMRLLCAHVLTSGFLTDADVVQGVEKLASRPPSTKEHAAALDMVHPFDGKKSNPLAPMFSVFHTKGWKRTLAANLVVALVKACGLEDDLPLPCAPRWPISTPSCGRSATSGRLWSGPARSRSAPPSSGAP